MFKRKFTDVECVFCLDGEYAIVVDINQFAYMKQITKTNENMAFCLKEHPPITTQNKFTHQKIDYAIMDPEKFVLFLETKKVDLETTDFYEWRLFLDYLGANEEIMLSLKQCAYQAKSELSIFSGWKAFKIIYKKSQIASFKIAEEKWDFFIQHGYGNSLLEPYIVPQLECVPSCILDLINENEIIMNGSAVVPNIKNFIDYATARIFILNNANQLINCQKIIQLLIDNGYIIVMRNLLTFQCIPPRNGKWNRIVIYATYLKCGKDIIENTLCTYTSFYYSNATTFVSSLDFAHYMTTNRKFDIKLTRALFETENKKEEEVELKWKMLRQPRCVTYQMAVDELSFERNLFIIQSSQDVKELPTMQILAEDEEEYVKSLQFSDTNLVMKWKYHFPLTIEEILPMTWGGTNYKLVIIRQTPSYLEMLSYLQTKVIISVKGVAYINLPNDFLLGNHTFIHCILNKITSDGILVWNI